MPSSTRSLVRQLAFFLCALSVCMSPAWADDRRDDEARVRFDAAREAYDRGDLRQAKEGFLAAHRASPRPAFLFNVAQCERRIGDLEQAAAYYRKYLAEAPTGAGAESARTLLAEIESERILRERARAREADHAQDALRGHLTRARHLEPTPFYRTWWFITGASVVVGAAAGVTAWAVATQAGAPQPRGATLGEVGAR